jgi:hypothetical protein
MSKADPWSPLKTASDCSSSSTWESRHAKVLHLLFPEVRIIEQRMQFERYGTA